MNSKSVLPIVVTSLLLVIVSFADSVKSVTNAMACISVPKTAEQVVYTKLKTIVIPEVTFRPPATLVDFIHFLKSASRDYDDPEIPLNQRGVNFFLKLSPAVSNATASTTKGIPVIPAMSVRSISLYDALKLVCDVTGTKFRICGNIVMVVPLSDPEVPVQPRSDKVLPIVQAQQTPEQIVNQKLKTIVIPEMNFRPPATLVDAIDFLRQASRDNDDEQIPEERRGVNVILKLPPSVSATPASATSGIPVIPAMSVRSISLYDALKLICDVTGTKFRIIGNIIMVVPRIDSDAQVPAHSKKRQK